MTNSLKNSEFDGLKPSSTLMEAGLKLGEDGDLASDPTRYRKIIG